MSKQVLDVQQMQHLQELGLDTSSACMAWCRLDGEKEYDHLLPKDEDVFKRCLVVKFIPAYTLFEVIGLLPEEIYPFPSRRITYDLWVKPGSFYYRNTFDEEDILKVVYNKDVIDAAYDLLVWCIENKYVETGKKEKA